MKNRKITIAVIAVLVISVLGIGIAFAAFSRSLTINGNGTIENSKWEVVFEGLTNTDTLDGPEIVGSAAVTTAPTIKNNATEISSFVASLRSPGDSITYNFKIHNTGDYAATVSSVVMASGVNLTTNTEARTSAANTLNAIDYKLYYTDNNALVGSGDAKDCLEPGEEENVSLRIVFSSTDETSTSVLPSEALLLDNLGIVVHYNQSTNGSCAVEQAPTPASVPFENIDGAYYTYETKSFIGTGVNNLIITENIIISARYSSLPGTDNGASANPRYTFSDSPGADFAAAHCTYCRLMSRAEAIAWDSVAGTENSTKRIGYFNGSASNWMLSDPNNQNSFFIINNNGRVGYTSYSLSCGVRPVADIPSTATMSGSGTIDSPYVITLSE